jgi:hypothetical protein
MPDESGKYTESYKSNLDSPVLPIESGNDGTMAEGRGTAFRDDESMFCACCVTRMASSALRAAPGT